MRRILTAALLALGGTLAMSGVASADIGDIQRITVDQTLFGSASEVEVTGTIDCQTTVEYGLWVGVAQDSGPSNPWPTFLPDGGSVTDDEADAEGVGAYGPNFNPPVGISDDSPCSQSLQGYDVLVQQNRDSADFVDGVMEVFVQAGTSAENGTRGPGPFIGDTFGLEDVDGVTFERTR